MHFRIFVFPSKFRNKYNFFVTVGSSALISHRPLPEFKNRKKSYLSFSCHIYSETAVNVDSIVAFICSAVSESRLSKPSLSPSHHLKVRVRVRVITSESESESESTSPSQKKNLSPSHKCSSPHIQHFFIFQNMKTNNKMYRMSE